MPNILVGSTMAYEQGSMTVSGWQESPHCLSTRTTMVTTLLFGYLLCSAYSGVLISYLASGHYGTPFSSLEEVPQKGTHTLCVRNESYAYVSLKVGSTLPGSWLQKRVLLCLVFQRNDLYRRVLNTGPCQGLSRPDQLVGVLCQANMAVLEIPSVMAAAIDARPDCQDDILMVRGRSQRATASLLLRRSFPHTKAIDYM